MERTFDNQISLVSSNTTSNSNPYLSYNSLSIVFIFFIILPDSESCGADGLLGNAHDGTDVLVVFSDGIKINYPETS